MSERPTEALRAEFRRCRSAPAFAVVNGDRHDAACDALDATVADLERDLAVSRAEAQAYLARIEADTTHISKLTAEVGRLREALAKSESAPKVSTTPIEEEAFPFPPADQPAPEDER